MRTTGFLLLTAFTLLFVIGRPQKKQQETRPSTIRSEAFERQEEQAPEELQVTFEAKNAEDAEIADILWLRKAARLAMDMGNPYFNVLQQNRDQEMVVDGIIRLEEDPMSAEYDANEILDLALPQEEGIN